MSKRYVRLTKGLKDKGRLVEADKVSDVIGDDIDHDWYQSIYYYNEDQYAKFKETGSVAGIVDVETDKLIFDFDNKENQNLAKEDADKLIQRLKNQGIPEKDIEIFFSGDKGFHVGITLDKCLPPEVVQKLATEKYGSGLTTLDLGVYNPSRVFRFEGTKHQSSGLYKTPLEYKQFKDLPISKIRKLATDPDQWGEFNWNPVEPADDFYSLPKKPEPVKKEKPKIDIGSKPEWMPDYLYSILEGEIKPGNRHEALMVLAARLRGVGFAEDTAYYMCKSALKSSIAVYGAGGTDKDELWNNIIQYVYGPRWKGGQYSPDTNPWLKAYCDENGFTTDEEQTIEEELGILHPKDLAKSFLKYIRNIDELTIKTDIEELDRRVRMTIGMSVGIVAGPSVGKTSVAIQILNAQSKAGERGVFFSYDMYRDMIGQKLAHKHTGKTEKQLREAAEGPEYDEFLADLFENEYKNITFIDRSAQTLDEIRRTLRYLQNSEENPLRFAVIDYNELIMNELTDTNASTAKTAQELRGMAKEFDICMIILYQPNKASGGPDDAIKNYLSIKGSSAIQQAASILIGMSRPGFNPDAPEWDKFMNIRVIKNRMGALSSIDLHWNGLLGELRTLTSEERMQLKTVRENKEREKEEENGGKRRYSDEWA